MNQAQSIADYSEAEQGNDIYALASGSDEATQFQLGTREYARHQHRRGQLFCVKTGLVRVQTDQAHWLSPPQRAIWIPAEVPHQVSLYGAIRGWSLLFKASLSAQLPAQACVFSVSPFLEALVTRLLSESAAPLRASAQAAIFTLLLDEIASAPELPLSLVMPEDKRLGKIAVAICQQASRSHTTQEWASWAGLSERNLSRLWRQQTGISFRNWCQQADLLKAMEWLAQGQSIQNIADQLAYAHPSNFIAMFQKFHANSPARMFNQHRHVSQSEP